MRTVLDYVGKREGFAIPDDTARLIAEDANGNVRKAILVLEALKMQKYALVSLSAAHHRHPPTHHALHYIILHPRRSPAPSLPISAPRATDIRVTTC